MNTSSYFHRMRLLLASLVLLMACSLFTPPTETEVPQPSATQTPEVGESTATEPLATATEPPTLAAPAITSTTGPRCTVLRDLNFRSGPGTAYHPPITALPANTALIPIGYNPLGIPGGSWVQVENPANQQKGWVSAGSQFINCNIDLTTLPQVSVAPPPTPVPPRAQSSNEDGTCGEGGIIDDQGHVYDCGVVFSGGLPVQFQVFKDGQEIGRAEGIQNVVFRVDRDGKEIYRNRENSAAYCLFGGDGPCNSWVLENYVYKWEAGGAAVEPGKYTVNIDANLDDPSIILHWQATLTITPP